MIEVIVIQLRLKGAFDNVEVSRVADVKIHKFADVTCENDAEIIVISI
jgi:hypothetical protein